MLMAAGRAPRGNGIIHTRNTFLTRAMQLIMTLGRYQQLVDELHLTIATTTRMTMMEPSDNVTLKDVARLFVGDGYTIAQVRDAFEWGQMALLNWSQGMDAFCRMEAMVAINTAHQEASQE